MRGSKFLNKRKFLNAVVLFQYVPRVLRLYLSWRKLNSNDNNLARIVWVKADSISFFISLPAMNHDNERQVLMNDGVDPGKQGTTRKTILQNLKLENKYLQMWNMMFVVSCAIAVSVDPLFFYLPVISEENKCLALDNKLKIAAICLRSVTDMVYVLNIILQFLCPYIDEAPLKLGRTVIVTDAWRIAKRYLLSYYLIDILAILPIPQVRETLLLLKCVYFFSKFNCKKD
ncbi:cyclic nucleotide-gated ion channel 1 [Quercus suber]|uniref:Cyclic nucleotide-gated ion channel 1 n=1 Tax=Quercus suber TaxID=58331 RepID=A0AAW0JQ63_QUESU